MAQGQRQTDENNRQATETKKKLIIWRTNSKVHRQNRQTNSDSTILKYNQHRETDGRTDRVGYTHHQWWVIQHKLLYKKLQEKKNLSRSTSHKPKNGWRNFPANRHLREWKWPIRMTEEGGRGRGRGEALLIPPYQWYPTLVQLKLTCDLRGTTR